MKLDKNAKLSSIGEDLAINYLINNGLEIISRNYHSAYGEIDIIAVQEDTVIFVEVKTRSSNLQNAFNSVSKQKQNKIIKTAQIFLSKNQKFENLYTRFDVIAIIKNKYGYNIKHLIDAFVP